MEEDFDLDIKDLVDPSDGIEAVEIDLDTISKEAGTYASELVENLTEFYLNNDVYKSNSVFKRHVETDLDSLKILIKMRKSDEITHDILIKAIGNNPGNASLYRSLTDMQRTMLNIQSKIDDTVKSLNSFMKGYQLELDFSNKEENTEKEEQAEDKNFFKGSKDFIEAMRQTI